MGSVGDRLKAVVVPLLSDRPRHARIEVGLSALLAGIVVGVVPVGSGVFGLPVRPLLVGCVVVYAVVSVAFDAFVEGAAVAFVFTAVFNVRAMFFVDGPEVRLISLLGLLTAALLVIASDVPTGWFRRTDRRIVGGALAVMVLWAALSALVSNGPSREPAIWYVVEHFRYLSLVALAALLVDRGGAKSVLAPLTFGLGATLVFAVDEVFAGEAGYLVNFGTVGYDIARMWPSPPLTEFPTQGTVLYEAAALGQNRMIVGMGILCLPIVIALSLRSRRHALLSLTGLLGLVSVVASGSHAAIAGLYAGLAPVGIWAAYLLFDRAGMGRARRLVLPASLAVGTLAVVAALAAAFSGPQNILFVRTNNMGIRVQQYATAIEVAARHPLFGVGGGGRNVDVVVGMGVHNIFLYHLAAIGVPGFLAYLTSVVGSTVLCGWRCLTADTRERWLWIGVLGAIAGFHAYAFWTVAWRFELLNAAYWVLVGVVVGAEPVEGDQLQSIVRQWRGRHE